MATRVKVGKRYVFQSADILDRIFSGLQNGDIVEVVLVQGGVKRGPMRHVRKRLADGQYVYTFCRVRSLTPYDI